MQRGWGWGWVGRPLWDFLQRHAHAHASVPACPLTCSLMFSYKSHYFFSCFLEGRMYFDSLLISFTLYTQQYLLQFIFGGLFIISVFPNFGTKLICPALHAQVDHRFMSPNFRVDHLFMPISKHSVWGIAFSQVTFDRFILHKLLSCHQSLKNSGGLYLYFCFLYVGILYFSSVYFGFNLIHFSLRFLR